MVSSFISIAMCTYNGEKYLQEQLDSIANQKRLPDELVISDDCSNDATHDIITKFSSQAPFTVRFFTNAVNIGSTKNFEKTIKLCEGNIILLSDQDDIWQPEKLSIIESIFIKSPDIGLVFSEAEIVDENLKRSETSLWDSFQFSKCERKKVVDGKAVNVIVKHSVVTGATMAFRRQYCDILLPIPSDHVHDNWISLILSAVTGVALIEKPLMKYRQHTNQQIGSGEGKVSLLNEVRVASVVQRNAYLHEIDLLTVMLGRLKQFSEQYPINEDVLQLVANKIKHRQARVNLPASKIMRIPTIVKEIATKRYWIHSNGLKSIAKDIFF